MVQGMEEMEIGGVVEKDQRAEARYAYYRRCQVFLRNGRQCKAPAMKGEDICNNHAGQIAAERRRQRERQAVLCAVVEQMRSAGLRHFETADIFADRRAIQKAISVVALAIATERIEMATAKGLLMELQMAARLLTAAG